MMLFTERALYPKALGKSIEEFPTLIIAIVMQRSQFQTLLWSTYKWEIISTAKEKKKKKKKDFIYWG